MELHLSAPAASILAGKDILLSVCLGSFFLFLSVQQSARNMPFSIPPLCLSPVRLRGQSWNRLSLDELACPPQIQVAEGNVTVEAGQPVTLTCQVSSTPETVVTWLFAGKPIVNSSTAENVTNGPPEGTASPAQQLYYLREVKADKSNRSSHLILAAAREQDSGSYACQASNRADTVTGNITLVVRAGSAGSASGDGSMMMSRGLIAGVLLAVFAILIGVLLFCCMCSLKRARLHSSLRNRRPSTVLSASSANGLLLGSSKMAQEQLDPLFQSSGSSAHPRSNGVAGKPASLLPVVTGQPDSRMVMMAHDETLPAVPLIHFQSIRKSSGSSWTAAPSRKRRRSLSRTAQRSPQVTRRPSWTGTELSPCTTTTK